VHCQAKDYINLKYNSYRLLGDNTAKKNVIVFDLDGVLADTVKQTLRHIEEETAIKKTNDDIKHYDLTIDLSLPRDYIIRAFRKAWKEYEKIEPVDPNIPYILNKLHEKSKIYIVTSSVGADKEIIGWLKKNNIVYDRLVHVKKDNDKLNVEADVFIEDNPHLAMELKNAGKFVILLKQPWNIEFRNNGIAFAMNWNELFSMINERLS